MTTIYLVRHAMSQSNIEGNFCGVTDVPLSEKGYRQLEFLAKRFAEIRLDRIYSSPLMRAVETAKAIGRAQRLDVTLRHELHEIDVGELEGLDFRRLTANYPDEMERYIHDPGAFSSPGGEAMAQVSARAVNALGRIAAENPGRTVAVVSHGDFIRAYTCSAQGKPLSELKNLKHSFNTGVTRVDYDDKLRPHVVFSGDVSHLPRSELTLFEEYVNGDGLKG